MLFPRNLCNLRVQPNAPTTTHMLGRSGSSCHLSIHGRQQSANDQRRRLPDLLLVLGRLLLQPALHPRVFQQSRRRTLAGRRQDHR